MQMMCRLSKNSAETFRLLQSKETRQKLQVTVKQISLKQLILYHIFQISF